MLVVSGNKDKLSTNRLQIFLQIRRSVCKLYKNKKLLKSSITTLLHYLIIRSFLGGDKEIRTLDPLLAKHKLLIFNQLKVK